MDTLTFGFYHTFYLQLVDACAATVERDNGDDHRYRLLSVQLLPADLAQTFVAVARIQLQATFAEAANPETYTFRYGLYADGVVCLLPTPHNLWDRPEVADAHDTWGFTVQDWVRDIQALYRSKTAGRERYTPIHEELIAKMWHPDRVSALLNKGGWELVEALL